MKVSSSSAGYPCLTSALYLVSLAPSLKELVHIAELAGVKASHPLSPRGVPSPLEAIAHKDRRVSQVVHGQVFVPATQLEQYRSRKDSLTQERDQHIAEAINQTLQDGETGLLFIGALHDVLSGLAHDIDVEQVKDREAVRSYFQELFSGQDEAKCRRLADYLSGPIGLHSSDC
ncbi:MAG: hypothetical protein HYX89_07390 [Chloroflexi bacterium]|nr:hypothetical protein [Chloroflexota bacterium]